VCNSVAFFLAKAPTRQFRTHLYYTPLIRLGTDLIPSATTVTPEAKKEMTTPVASIKLIISKLLAVDGEMKKINNSLQTNTTTKDNLLVGGGR
jgi:hypothetical protein